jgi:hypothetical protein
MSVNSLLRRIRSDKARPTLVEVSVGLAVALLLVMTALRFLGGFDTVPHRGAQASTADASTPPFSPARATKPAH